MMTENLSISSKRSFFFKLFCLLLFIFAVFGWLRFSQSIFQWHYLVMYQVKPGPLFTLVSGLLIGVSMSIGMVAFWIRKPWSKKYLQITIALLFLGWWLDYLILTKNPTALINWPFRLIGSLVVIGFIYGYLQLAYPNKKR